MRLAVALVVVLAACTDSPPSSSGPGVTTHVESFDIAAGQFACFANELFDADPNMPGPQYDCSVMDSTTAGDTVLPECNNATSPASSTNKPCWAIESDTTNCSTTSHLSMVIERSTPPPPDNHVVIQCVTQ